MEIIEDEIIEDEIFIVLERTRKSTDDDRRVRLVMCKRCLGNDLFALVAIGYEGGGSWSEFYAVYQLDDFHESILETKESLKGESDDSTYYETYNQLHETINNYCDFNEEFIPSLKEEFVASLISDKGFKYYESWNWDDGIHLAASSNWQIQFNWD
jgi:hypothetical protein